MKCPRTGNNLKTLKVGGIAVEISESCGGVFFDNQELNSFKNADEIRGSALAEHLKQFNRKLPNESERIKCPKCVDTVMMRRYYSPLKVLEIDECPGCAGIWLDSGELEKLQDIKLSQSELTHLRNQMVEQASGYQIEVPTHRFMESREPSKLEKFFQIAIDAIL
jgi:hypothetical protein